MSTGPQLIRPTEKAERNWLPIIVAAAVVGVVAAAAIFFISRSNRAPEAAPVNAAPDAYAASLPITDLKMSESSGLAGNKVTYLDGHVANRGTKTVSGATLLVIFRDPTGQAAQHETQALKVIRTRDPYIDLEPLSAAPLKPGEGADFRLIFDTVSNDWDGAFPELRVIHADAQ